MAISTLNASGALVAVRFWASVIVTVKLWGPLARLIAGLTWQACWFGQMAAGSL